MLILHASFRNQPVVKVNIIGRKFRGGATGQAGWQRYLDVVPLREPAAAVMRSDEARVTTATIKTAMPGQLNKV